MNFWDWYTDTMDIFRVIPDKTGAVVRNTRSKVYSDIPCRIYMDGAPAPTMNRQAADYTQQLKIACKNDVDIRAGDEVIITRGGRIGHDTEKSRAFAGEPHKYYEPFGAVAPQLEHQEISLHEVERIDGTA